MKAIWRDTIIAQSDNTVVVESNHYFPKSSIEQKYFESSDKTTHCPWKGTASYYHVVIEGQRNFDAAWCYLDPKPAASEIAGRIAFWRGVEVTDSRDDSI